MKPIVQDIRPIRCRVIHRDNLYEIEVIKGELPNSLTLILQGGFGLAGCWITIRQENLNP